MLDKLPPSSGSHRPASAPPPEAISGAGPVHLHQHRSVQRNAAQDSRQLRLHEHRNLQQNVQLHVGLELVDVAQQARAYETEVTNQARAFEAHVHNQAAAQTGHVRHEMSAFLEQFKHEAFQREREREIERERERERQRERERESELFWRAPIAESKS